MIQPVIIAGGVGSRLWPLSREQYPKQFLSLFNNKSLLVNTIDRLNGVEHSDSIIVCNNEHRFLVAEQLRESDIDIDGIILEPIGKNTAPAVALSALYSLSKSANNDPILLVLAADHEIKNVNAFRDAIIDGIELAENGYLVTFGIVPKHPETGYGYIQVGEKLSDNARRVSGFKEKPDVKTAEVYISSNEYLWNSGMFMFRASAYLNELRLHRPDIYAACEDSFSKVEQDLDFTRVDVNSFSQCPSESIDYAVMEKTDKAAVISMDAGWSDVGSWSSLWDISDKDPNGNVSHGDVISHRTSGSYIYSESALVTTVGLENVVVVQTKDAVLVADRDSVQDVKTIVDNIKVAGRLEHHIHREVYRPWGKYDSIDSGDRYQVKHLTVKPGEGISVQMHHHRAEHWIVVSGTAKVTIDGKAKIVAENESVYIPVGTQHSLENPGKIPLDIIEVRSGAYLEEDDIVRFADRYGRV
jgi:mannose-1-phosphate guanylyltransferase (GDP) (EC 2.7.7.22)/mannose-6-phosphate isomerase, type 2 (EC 5.3.1.8)